MKASLFDIQQTFHDSVHGTEDQKARAQTIIDGDYAKDEDKALQYAQQCILKRAEIPQSISDKIVETADLEKNHFSDLVVYAIRKNYDLQEDIIHRVATLQNSYFISKIVFEYSEKRGNIPTELVDKLINTTNRVKNFFRDFQRWNGNPSIGKNDATDQQKRLVSQYVELLIRDNNASDALIFICKELIKKKIPFSQWNEDIQYYFRDHFANSAVTLANFWDDFFRGTLPVDEDLLRIAKSSQRADKLHIGILHQKIGDETEERYIDLMRRKYPEMFRSKEE